MTAQPVGALTRPYLETALKGLRSLPDIFLAIFDADLRYVLVAGQAVREAGNDPAKLEGRPMAEVVPPERHAIWEPLYRAALRGESSTLEVAGMTDDRWYQVAVTPWYDDAGAIVGGLTIGRDITAHKQAQAQLNATAERWRAIFDSDRLGVGIRDPAGVLVECNERYASILGATPQALIGTTYAEILAPASAIENTRVYSRRLSERPGIAVDQAITLLDGREVTVRSSVFGVHGPDGEPGYQAVVIDDLTDQLRMQRELEQARRVDSIARLAGGVAHDLNNKLAVIMGFTEMVSAKLGAASQLQHELDQVRAAAAHCISLTNDLLVFGGQQMTSQQRFAPSTALAGIKDTLRSALGSAITLVIDDKSPDAQVLGDPTQFEQVLLNLVVNAREAIPNEGTVTIRTASRGPAGVAISVSDTGIGMPSEVRTHVFEPFFTTKPFGQGAGLGLATVAGIIEQMGGTIAAESRPGYGSTFTIELPIDAAPPDDGDPALTPMPARDQRALTVLVADGETQLRALVTLMLSDAGFHVLAAADGARALELLHGPVDLLLSELELPDVDGRELARRAVSMHPALRVVFMSGSQAPHGAFLAKPFTDRELTAVISAALKDGGEA